MITVFTDADMEATDCARSFFKGYPPSSPCTTPLRDGELVFILERHQIEEREKARIAAQRARAFDTCCTPAVQQAC